MTAIVLSISTIKTGSDTLTPGRGDTYSRPIGQLACICKQVWSQLAKDVFLGVELRIWLVAIALEGDALPERHTLWRIDGIHLIVCSIRGAQDLQ